MTDQKQAPERKFPDWIDVGEGRYGFSNIEAVKGNSCRYIRKDLHDAAIKRQAGAAKTLRETTLAEVQHLKDKDRSEYNAAKSLDSEREANARLTAEVEYLAKQRDELAAAAKVLLDKHDELLKQSKFRTANSFRKTEVLAALRALAAQKGEPQ